MKPHFRIQHRSMEFSILPPTEDQLILGLHTSITVNGTSFQSGIHFSARVPDDLINLALLYKAIGYSLSMMQPGYLTPLPEGDPNEVDAMRLDYEVNRLWREENNRE